MTNAVYTRSRVTTVTTLRRRHRLPKGSTPKVLEGQPVKAMETLATAEVATEHRIIDIAEKLGVRPRRVPKLLTAQEGDQIAEGDVLATRRILLGLRRRQVLSPLNGRIVRLMEGQLLLEGERDRLEVEATTPGKVIIIEPEDYITVETTGALLQIAWGTGGLTVGTLRTLDQEPGLETGTDRFNIDHRGAILAIGSPLTEAFLEGAIEIRAKGLIAASMPASLVPRLKDVEFPVGITQGFGTIPMSSRILNLLNTYNGREIVVDMGDDADWREKRPEIIIPLSSQQSQQQQAAYDEQMETAITLAVGYKVRVLQPPYLGEIGTVTALPAEERQLASGLWTRGAVVEIDGDTEEPVSIFVPFANLEHLG